MALRGNNARFNVSPHFRVSGVASIAGAGLYINHNNKYLTGRLRNFASEVPLASYPSGATHPLAWVMPQTAGAMSSRNSAGFSLDIAGSGAMGVNGVGTTSITFSLTGTGALIVSGAGTAEFTITATANAVATLNGDGSATMTFSATAGATALAWGDSLASFSITGTLTPYAVGHMEGTTEEAGLTNAGIANSVWGKVIEAGYSAEGILRLLAAHAAGSATGLEGADPQFVGLDGVTTRINGTYSAGTRTIDALDAD